MTAKDRHTAAILAALQSGPMDTKAIIAATGLHGTTLGNVIRGMLKDGVISRAEITTGRWRYYLGQTAPASPPRHPRHGPSAPRKPPCATKSPCGRSKSTGTPNTAATVRQTRR